PREQRDAFQQAFETSLAGAVHEVTRPTTTPDSPRQQARLGAKGHRFLQADDVRVECPEARYQQGLSLPVTVMKFPQVERGDGQFGHSQASCSGGLWQIFFMAKYMPA